VIASGGRWLSKNKRIPMQRAVNLKLEVFMKKTLIVLGLIVGLVLPLTSHAEGQCAFSNDVGDWGLEFVSFDDNMIQFTIVGQASEDPSAGNGVQFTSKYGGKETICLNDMGNFGANPDGCHHNETYNAQTGEIRSTIILKRYQFAFPELSVVRMRKGAAGDDSCHGPWLGACELIPELSNRPICHPFSSEKVQAGGKSYHIDGNNLCIDFKTKYSIPSNDLKLYRVGKPTMSSFFRKDSSGGNIEIENVAIERVDYDHIKRLHSYEACFVPQKFIKSGTEFRVIHTLNNQTWKSRPLIIRETFGGSRIELDRNIPR